MESIFGEDFSAVRVHVGLQARSLGAVACTAGSDIYFAPGRFQPTTPEGEHLLVCQLIRVLQQRSGRVKNPFGTGLALVRDAALDEEAQRMSRSMLASSGGTGRRQPQPARRGASPTESAVSRLAPCPHREGRKLTEEAFARFVEENGARIDQVVAMDGAWEAWLQVEYALALSSRHDATHIKLEEPGIYLGDHRPDITLSIGDTSYLIELRCEAPRETAQAFAKRVHGDVEKLKKLATPHVKVLIAYAMKDATARLIRADKELLDLMGIATGFVAATKEHEKAQVFQAVYL
jgi:hypothetical protein